MFRENSYQKCDLVFSKQFSVNFVGVYRFLDQLICLFENYDSVNKYC